MTTEELRVLCDARTQLCTFCQAYECDHCMVTRLINDAFDETNDEVDIYIFGIQWDTDEDNDIDLPTEINHRFTNDDLLEETISNWLSDEYGFCHKGFQYEIRKETNMETTDKIIPTNYPNSGYPTLVREDYVISPCKNAFNNKVSYWITKRDIIAALYCFSVTSVAEARKLLENYLVVSEYIWLFKEKIES